MGGADLKEAKPKKIGALGEARAENARLKRQLEVADKTVQAAEEILGYLYKEGWVQMNGRTLFHGRAGFLRDLLHAVCRYRKFTK